MKMSAQNILLILQSSLIALTTSSLSQSHSSVVPLDAQQCLTSVASEDRVFFGCQNKVVVVNSESLGVEFSVDYSPESPCQSDDPICSDTNQILAMSLLVKNVLVCHSNQAKSFYCNKFRQSPKDSSDVVDPEDSGVFQAPHTLTSPRVNPYITEHNDYITIAGYFDGITPDICRINLKADLPSKCATSLRQDFLHTESRLLYVQTEMISVVKIGVFTYVFFNEVYYEYDLKESIIINGKSVPPPNDGLPRARIARVCSEDESLSRIWRYFAKGRLQCVKDDVLFTKLVSVTYDESSQLLIAVFTTHYRTLVGSAMCFYSAEWLHRQFSGPLEFYHYSEFEAVHEPDFACEEQQLAHFQHGPYLLVRDNVVPDEAPLAVIPAKNVTNVFTKTFSMPEEEASMVIFALTSEKELLRFNLAPSGDLCDLKPLSSGPMPEGKVIGVHLMTHQGREVLVISDETSATIHPTEKCHVHTSQESCTAIQDPYCVWRQSQCVSNPDSTDPTGRSITGCPYRRVPAGYRAWSEPFLCSGNCTCRERRCDVENSTDAHNATLCPSGPVILDVSKCPVDGNWTEWGVWGPCLEGTRVRSRRCDNPPPRNNGAPCSGARTISESCDTHEEQIPGLKQIVISDWSGWTIAEVTSERWIEMRTRARYEQGSATISMEEDTRPCSVTGGLMICTNSAYVTHLYSMWSVWSPCSSVCGDGVRARQRKCDPDDVVCPSTGYITETSSCSNEPCNRTATSLDNELCWSDWSPCTSKCGSGRRSRQRVCPSGLSTCVNGRETETSPCSGSECEAEVSKVLMRRCHTEAVEEYACRGPACPSETFLQKCESVMVSGGVAPLHEMSFQKSRNDTPYMKYILAITVTVIVACMLTVFIIIAVRKIQKRGCCGSNEEEVNTRIYEPMTAMFDLPPPSGPVPGSRPSDRLQDLMSSGGSMARSHLWNPGPMHTFSDDDGTPINNGFFSIDRLSRQRRADMQNDGSMYATAMRPRNSYSTPSNQPLTSTPSFLRI